jgi:hypothetical protein
MLQNTPLPPLQKKNPEKYPSLGGNSPNFQPNDSNLKCFGTCKNGVTPTDLVVNCFILFL